jgi:hypothetical protein
VRRPCIIDAIQFEKRTWLLHEFLPIIHDARGFEGIAAAVNSHLDPLADNANSPESCMSWIDVFRCGFTWRHRRIPFRVKRSVEVETNPLDWYPDSRR